MEPVYTKVVSSLPFEAENRRLSISSNDQILSSFRYRRDQHVIMKTGGLLYSHLNFVLHILTAPKRQKSTIGSGYVLKLTCKQVAEAKGPYLGISAGVLEPVA